MDHPRDMLSPEDSIKWGKSYQNWNQTWVDGHTLRIRRMLFVIHMRIPKYHCTHSADTSISTLGCIWIALHDSNFECFVTMFILKKNILCWSKMQLMQINTFRNTIFLMFNHENIDLHDVRETNICMHRYKSMNNCCLWLILEIP